MRITSAQLIRRVRIPGIAHDVDLLTHGPSFPGLDFDLGEVSGNITIIRDRVIVYVVPAANVAGVDPAVPPIPLTQQK